MEMAHRRESAGVDWASGIQIVVAVWLIASPWLAGYVYGVAPSIQIEASLWVNIVIGVALLILSISRLAVTNESWAGLTFINFLLGGFLIATPFIFRYTSMPRAVFTDIFTGIVVLGLAIWSAASSIAYRTR